jgi:putative spermidine/putrescine transport system ATP-binding protein
MALMSATFLPTSEILGWVFQKYALFPHLTVVENVAYPLKRRKVKSLEIKRLVEETLKMVGLDGFGDRYPRQMSGGQQQRVALARAFVFHPELLLMDEPLGALDKKLRDRMQVEIRALQKRVGITTVYVTHDQVEAMTMSDRVAVMNQGRIEQLGSPQELYDRPMTEFVAGFVGDSNLIPTTVMSDYGDVAKVNLLNRPGILARTTSPIAKGQEFKLLIRPEKLCVSTEQSKSRENWLEGIVSSIVFLGDATQLTVAVEGTVIKARIANRASEPKAAIGQRVVVSWESDDCSLVVAGDTP